MKGLGENSPFHRFTNPRRDKSVYIWSWGSYLLFIMYTASDNFVQNDLVYFFMSVYDACMYCEAEHQNETKLINHG